MRKDIVHIGLIGIGYWGVNYVRIFSELAGVELKYICDFDREKLKRAAKLAPQVKMVQDYQKILNDNDVEAVVISTPASTHYVIARECLESGKKVMVEKPLTLDSGQARKLAELAESRQLILMTGHVFEYNPAIIQMKQLLDQDELGDLYYLHFTRTGLGPIRDDVNALWDLAPHDISILLYLLEEEPSKVISRGRSFIQAGIEDVVFVTLEFPSGVIANIHTSWIDPRKKREITAVGSKKMMVFDDMASSEKLFVYDKGVVKELTEGTLGEFQLALHVGDVHIPKIEGKEPLKEECAHFIDCIKTGAIPKSDGWSGYRVVKTLERAQRSLKKAQP